jgi:protein-disulfide isomerase
MEIRLVATVMLASACWGSNAKPAETAAKTDQLEVELAARENENSQLKRRLEESTDARDELIKKLEAIETKLKEVEASVAAGASAPIAPPSRPPRRYGPDPAKTYAATLGKWPQRGPSDAKVTLVVAHEYACPYCEKVRPTLDELLKKYGKDLRIVFKQLVVHPRTAMPSALASCAANRQKKFDKLDPLLWEKGYKARTFDVDVTAPDGTTQRCWTVPAGCPVVIGFATEAGLNISRFKADMQTCELELMDAAKEFQQLSVSATPSFFINGRFLSGAMPIENFSHLIDEELAKANDRIKKGAKKSRYYQEWVIEKGETSHTQTPPASTP